jgi:rare lipoprotein A
MRIRSIALAALLALGLAACASGPPEPKQASAVKIGKPYQIKGRWYQPRYEPGYDEVGIASWYGDYFHGRPTANGERFDKDEISAAHKTLPLPSIVKVTNLENGRAMEIRVNDRGPFVGERIIDLSEGAARALGFRENGLAKVRVQFVRLDGELRDPLPAAPTLIAEARSPAPRPPATEIAVAALPAPVPAPAPARAVRAPSPPAPQARPVAVAAATPPRPACRLPSGPLYVQVGAFADPDEARRMRRAFTTERAELQPVFRGQQALVRLRVGPMPDAESAIAALAQAKRLGAADAIVTDGPQSLRPLCGAAA